MEGYQSWPGEAAETEAEEAKEFVSASPSPSPEYCEDDSQEVRKCPSLEELVHDSDAETTLDGVGFYKENAWWWNYEFFRPIMKS